MNEEKKEQSFLDKMKEGFEELKDKAEEVRTKWFASADEMARIHLASRRRCATS